MSKSFIIHQSEVETLNETALFLDAVKKNELLLSDSGLVWIAFAQWYVDNPLLTFRLLAD